MENVEEVEVTEEEEYVEPVSDGPEVTEEVESEVE